jgi:hypothetical protein
MAGAETVDTIVRSIAKNELPVLPYILGTVCYIGGSFMMVSGALSLKKHAENPAGEPVAKGVSRLLAGGSITAVPALTSVIQETTHLGTGKASFQNFQVNFQ